ncbi:MAG: LuxR family transcriptional regulator, regulator of acetate metabolism [Thermoleophilaceae bacterium]|jgi:DNA-binding CsgD family transcriptional regulator|nr:LuxR family transcriptional regulator, regulator of acetate metabolism [Thermoleophilaceae bacterium]
MSALGDHVAANRSPATQVGDDELDARVAAVMEHVSAVLSAPTAALPKVADFHTVHREVEEALRMVVDELRDAPAGRADLWSTLIELHQVQRELVEQRLVQRLEALERVRRALDRLRELGPVSEILRHAAGALSDSAGLDRVLLSQVKDSELLPVHAHFRDDPDGAERAVEALRETPLRLEYPVIETELMRRRRASIVRHPGSNPRVRTPPIPVGEGLSYVAAPILLDGRAIGFFHGGYADRHVESLERDSVWAFADGFAQVFERAVLRRRVREQRRQLRQLVAWTDAMAAELSEGAIELEVEREPASASVRPDAIPADTGDASRLRELLTRRELDVLRLMARGDSNKAIANELVVSEGTVKFHVKNILRKLRAANRVEAASRYVQLSGR